MNFIIFRRAKVCSYAINTILKQDHTLFFMKLIALCIILCKFFYLYFNELASILDGAVTALICGINVFLFNR